ncbi:hypothetical protein ACFO6R_06010 [Eubacterium multiforme]|uniref:FixJ family two-component response regulator n=1 Tax=Eubacterium multiforme TaxID=83339 RepID=A0ABT9US52_9FIRM|nr:hypothetical protein [Eubacterium multiforme]MDQ0149139.1 FixJ family two-component response regulator [Eubacterium multiforme]
MVDTNIEGILNSYKYIIKDIRAIDIEIDVIENEYKGCGALSYEEKTGETYKISSSVETEIVLKEKKIEYLLYLKRSKELKIKKIENLVSNLTEKEYYIISSYYFRGIKNSIIADHLEMNEKYLISKRKGIIKKLESEISKYDYIKF